MAFAGSGARALFKRTMTLSRRLELVLEALACSHSCGSVTEAYALTGLRADAVATLLDCQATPESNELERLLSIWKATILRAYCRSS